MSPLLGTLLFTLFASSALGLEVIRSGSLPTPRRHTAAIYDGVDYVYILGGMEITKEGKELTLTNQIVRYDLSATENPSTILEAEFPVGVAHGAATVDLAGDIYYLGGGDINNITTYSKQAFKLTFGPTGVVTVTPLGDLTTPLIGATAHFAAPDQIYIYGGETNSEEILSSVTKYVPSTGVSSELSVLPYPVFLAASVQIDGKVFVFGGIENSTSFPFVTNTVAQYNVGDGTSVVLEQRLISEVQSPVVAEAGKFVYVIGGYIGGDYSNQRVTEFNLATKEVLEICVKEQYQIIPTDASAIYSEKYNKIYIFGGGTNVTTSDVLYIPLDTIEKKPCPPTEDNGANFNRVSFALGFLLLVTIQFC